jgi:hypothetical protein
MSLFVAFIYVAAVLMLQFVSGKLSQCSDPSKHLRADCRGFDALVLRLAVPNLLLIQYLFYDRYCI